MSGPIPTAWISADPGALDSRPVTVDAVALRSAYGRVVPRGAPLAMPHAVAEPFDPDPAVTDGAGVLLGHLAEPLDLAGVTTPTVGQVAVVTRARVVVAALFATTGFTVPGAAKRAPSIEYT